MSYISHISELLLQNQKYYCLSPRSRNRSAEFGSCSGKRLFFFFLICFAPSLDSAGSTSSKIHVLNRTRSGVISIRLFHVKE